MTPATPTDKNPYLGINYSEEEITGIERNIAQLHELEVKKAELIASLQNDQNLIKVPVSHLWDVLNDRNSHVRLFIDKNRSQYPLLYTGEEGREFLDPGSVPSLLIGAVLLSDETVLQKLESPGLSEKILELQRSFAVSDQAILARESTDELAHSLYRSSLKFMADVGIIDKFDISGKLPENPRLKDYLLRQTKIPIV